METRVIGLCGPIGSGKSTIAAALYKRLPHSVMMSFADGVRDVMELVYDIPASQWKDTQFKSTPNPAFGGATPRKGLQLVGTEGFRAFYGDTWVDYLWRRIKEAHYRIVIIDDVRFINEAEFLREIGGDLIYIESKTPEDVAQDASWLATTKLGNVVNRVLHRFNRKEVHASEANFTKLREMADYVVRNNWRVDLPVVSNRADQNRYLAVIIKRLLNHLYNH